MIRVSLRDFLAGGPSSREKHLDKFFKIFHMGFWWLDLVTCSWLILVTKNACFVLWGFFSGQFSKTFHFSLAYCDCSLSCPFFSLLNSPCSLKNPPFSSSSLHQSSRKGMGFVIFSMYFLFIALDFLDFEFLLSFEKYDVRIWFGYILLSLLYGFYWFW